MIGNSVHLADKEYSPQRGPLIDSFGNVIHHNYADTTISGSTRMMHRKAHRHVRMEREAVERKRLFDVKVRHTSGHHGGEHAAPGTVFIASTAVFARRTDVRATVRRSVSGPSPCTHAAPLTAAARDARGAAQERDPSGASGAAQEAQAREGGERRLCGGRCTPGALRAATTGRWRA